MPLLFEVAENRDEDMQAQTALVWDHCVTMAGELGASLRRPSLIQKLNEWHQVIWERWREKNLPWPKEFPKPPLAEIPTIQPILDEAGLIEEGKQQSNCVGFYGDRVRSGSVLK